MARALSPAQAATLKNHNSSNWLPARGAPNRRSASLCRQRGLSRSRANCGEVGMIWHQESITDVRAHTHTHTHTQVGARAHSCCPHLSLYLSLSLSLSLSLYLSLPLSISLSLSLSPSLSLSTSLSLSIYIYIYFFLVCITCHVKTIIKHMIK